MSGLTSDSFDRLPRRVERKALVRLAARTDVGCVRANNQDHFHVDPDGAFMIVADGMGGHPGGDVASHLATEAAAAVLDEHRGLSLSEGRAVMRRAFLKAHRALKREALFSPRLARMGTTLLCVARADSGELIVAHVGDSRLYRQRGDALAQLTRDHSLLNELLQQQMVTPLKAHERRHLGHILTRSVSPVAAHQPDVAKVRVEPGDRFLLATDGLYGPLSPSRMSLALSGAASVTTACELLMTGALDAGAPDNVTAIVFEVADGAPVR